MSRCCEKHGEVFVFLEFSCYGVSLIYVHLSSALQKFKFCGDLDCPDWALAAISLLTKLVSSASSVQVFRRFFFARSDIFCLILFRHR